MARLFHRDVVLTTTLPCGTSLAVPPYSFVAVEPDGVASGRLIERANTDVSRPQGVRSRGVLVATGISTAAAIDPSSLRRRDPPRLVRRLCHKRKAMTRSVRPKIAVLRPTARSMARPKRFARSRRWSSSSNGDTTSNSAAAFPSASVGQSSESDVMVNRHRAGPASSRLPHGPTRFRTTAVGASMSTSTR